MAVPLNPADRATATLYVPVPGGEDGMGTLSVADENASEPPKFATWTPLGSSGAPDWLLESLGSSWSPETVTVLVMPTWPGGVGVVARTFIVTTAEAPGPRLPM